ncbi:MAG: hypothetical protein ABWJ42_04500 [Sulfolobales archaeon]
MPEIRLSISESTYRELQNKAEREGYKSVEEFILSIVQSYLKRSLVAEKPLSEELARLERRMMDLVNKYTSKVDELAHRMSELYEIIDDLRDKYSELNNKYEEIKKIVEISPQKTRRVEREEKIQEKTEVKREREHRETPETRETPAKKTAIEVLREQKIIFESAITSKIRDRDSFFKRLESDGAKVIKLSNERIAVDPDFWSEFLKKLDSIKEDSEEIIKRSLSREEYRLFERLKKDGLIAYSTISKKWILIEE